jgi:hypothetical protein
MVDIHVLVVYRRFRTRIAPSLNFTHTFPLCSLFPLEYSLTHSLTHSLIHSPPHHCPLVSPSIHPPPTKP